MPPTLVPNPITTLPTGSDPLEVDDATAQPLGGRYPHTFVRGSMSLSGKEQRPCPYFMLVYIQPQPQVYPVICEHCVAGNMCMLCDSIVLLTIILPIVINY